MKQFFRKLFTKYIPAFFKDMLSFAVLIGFLFLCRWMAFSEIRALQILSVVLLLGFFLLLVIGAVVVIFIWCRCFWQKYLGKSKEP